MFYKCDYCDADASGGCYGFHACAEHLDRAAADARKAWQEEERAGKRWPLEVRSERAS